MSSHPHYKSWSDLRKRQLKLLAPSLHGQVDYFLTRYHEVHNAYGRACIMVDGTEAIYFSWVEMYEQEMYNYDEAHPPHWENDATFCDQNFINALTTYRSLSITDVWRTRISSCGCWPFWTDAWENVRSRDWCRRMTGTAPPMGAAVLHATL